MSQDIWAIEDLYLSRDWGKNQRRGEAAPETSHTCSWFQGHRSLALESSGQAWWAAPTLWCQQPSWPSWPQPWPLTHQTLKKMLPCRRVGPAPILSQGEKLDFSDQYFFAFYSFNEHVVVAVLRLAWSVQSDTKQMGETLHGRRRRNRAMPPVRWLANHHSA